jgi:hypothetical protein
MRVTVETRKLPASRPNTIPTPEEFGADAVPILLVPRSAIKTPARTGPIARDSWNVPWMMAFPVCRRSFDTILGTIADCAGR